ncbi:FK506-binding protein 15-like isoform X2 [Ptychodera flava]|uniref:FK506-binding protein 15-like isoform X2 n=1 Tax=Ptychodera flava TaxID=63121 RepID=UPI00396A4E22
MFFGGDDDDSDFLSPEGSSKLGSIFGMDHASSQGGNESLTYTAPKQPRKQAKGDQGGAPQVILALAVQAYKYVNGQYNKQGKLGAALLGNQQTNEYRILLYVGKQQQVASAKITASFSFVIQSNKYATFYDDQRQSWSVMFDTDQNVIDFSKQVALAKINSAGGTTTGVVQQDLVLGDSQGLESGDSVEVKYTGWLYTNNTFGKVFDSNVNSDKAFRCKLGKGKVIKGWDEGILGMKKGGRRLIIVPPSMAYGSKGIGDRVPPNSTLIFDIEIKKVKFSKEREEKSSSSSSSVAGTPTPEESSKTDSSSESGVRSRTQSLNEQITTNPSETKAKLISRMAKMGQPMLPMMGATAAQPDSTDSEAEDAHAAASGAHGATGPHPVIPPKPEQQAQHQQQQQQPAVQQPQPAQPTLQPQPQPQLQSASPYGQPFVQPQPMAQAPVPQQQLALYHSQPQMQPPQMQQPQAPFPQYTGTTTSTQMYGQPPMQQPIPPVSQYGAIYPQPQPPPQQTSVSDITTPVLLSETRQQQTEIRLAIGKVTDKIESLSAKIDHMHVQGSQSLAIPGGDTKMESSVVIQNIQRIVQENERLRKESFEKSSRIEVQNEKISELLQRNQQFVEQSNVMLEQRNDSFKYTTAQSQARVLELEQEKVNLTTELSAATSRISTMQLELANYKQKESELKLQLQNTMATSQANSEEIHTLKSTKFECETKIEKLSNSLKEEKLEVKKYKSRLENMEEEFTDVKAEKDSLEKSLADRKKKALAEKKKAEEEMEELKKSFEEEIESLKSKLRYQKTSTDAAAAEQVALLEKELENQWKEKCDRLVTQTNEKHQRAYDELSEEKEEVARKLAAVEEKFAVLKSSHGEGGKQIEQLRDELEEAREWKDKFESLQRSSGSLKDRYESRIKQLSESLSEANAAAASATSASASSGGGGEYSKEELIVEVKKIMNNVYYSLRSEFEADHSYTGTEILATMMNTIKAVTLKLMEGGGKKESEDEEEEEEESEESEMEEESEEEEEEEAAEGDVKIEEALHVGNPPDSGPPSAPPPPPPVEEVEESRPESESTSQDVPKDEQKEEPEDVEAEGEQQKDEAAVAKETSTEVDAAVAVVTVSAEADAGIAVDAQAEADAGVALDTEVEADAGVAMDTKAEADAGPTESDHMEESPEPEEDNKEELSSNENDLPAEGAESQSEQQEPERKEEKSEDLNSQEENNAQLPESEQISPDLPPVQDDNDDDDDDDVKQDAADDTEDKRAEETDESSVQDPLTEAAKSKETDNKSDDLFGDADNTVEDTFGPEFTKKEEEEATDDKTKVKKDKNDESSDEDVTKPRPPPPLFPDDDDEDDLDWLN